MIETRSPFEERTSLVQISSFGIYTKLESITLFEI